MYEFSLRGWGARVGLFLVAFSAASVVLVARGSIHAESPIWFTCLVVGATGVPAALGVGFIVTAQPLPVRAKRKIIGMAIVLAAITGFSLMFWIIGGAAYNQIAPR